MADSAFEPVEREFLLALNELWAFATAIPALEAALAVARELIEDDGG